MQSVGAWQACTLRGQMSFLLAEQERPAAPPVSCCWQLLRSWGCIKALSAVAGKAKTLDASWAPAVTAAPSGSQQPTAELPWWLPYRGKWAQASQQEVDDELAKGTPHCYRFRVPPNQDVTIKDGIRGEVRVIPSAKQLFPTEPWGTSQEFQLER